MADENRDLAGNGTLGTFDDVQLWAGESDIISDSAPYAAETIFEKYRVLAKNAAGELIHWNPGGVAPATIAVGFAAQPMDTTAATGTGAVTEGPFFKGGVVNPLALVWPAAADTLAERVAAFEGTQITIRKLL